MPSRFGIRDLIVIVLLLAVGVSVWISMVQRDREWGQVQDVRKKLDSLTDQVATLQKSPAVPAADVPRAEARDASWARAGVPIEWQPAWDFATDPTGQPDFQYGGEFTEILEGAPDKITPYLLSSVYGRRIADLVTEPLADFDPRTSRLRGVLAAAWQSDPGGTWLRVRLRPQAVFSDGRPVTAGDVRWTFHELLMRPEIKADRLRALVSNVIDRVTVLDDRTVEFSFKAANYANVEMALTLAVLPAGFYRGFEPSQLNAATGLLKGSGPFRLETLDPARQWAPPAPVVLVRNERYWGPKPPIDQIRFKAVSDELARLTEYKGGNADMIAASAPQFLAVADEPDWSKGNKALNWVNMRCGRSVLIWNCGNRGGKPTRFQDKRVRLAMTHLIDRERMVRDIWKGCGTVGTGLFVAGTLGYDAALTPWPFDTARAAAMLGEAEWKKDEASGALHDASGEEFAFELTYFAGGEIADRFATFIKDSVAAAGIRCELRRVDFAARGPILDQRDFDAILYGWFPSSPEPDPRQLFHSAAIAGGDNLAQWSLPEADRLIDEARGEMDVMRREGLWRQFQRLMHDEQPVTWIRVAPQLRFVKSDIGNVNMYPTGLALWEFYLRVPATVGSGD